MANENTKKKSKKPEPLINPESLFDRPAIRLDGTIYEIRTHAEMPPAAMTRTVRRVNRIRQLQELDAATPENDQEHADLTELVLRDILVAPAEVLTKMDSAAKVYAISLFFGRFTRATEKFVVLTNNT